MVAVPTLCIPAVVSFREGDAKVESRSKGGSSKSVPTRETLVRSSDRLKLESSLQLALRPNFFFPRFIPPFRPRSLLADHFQSDQDSVLIQGISTVKIMGHIDKV